MTANNGWLGKPGALNPDGEVPTDELVRRLQHLGDWQAADRIEALQARVAELEAALATARREGMEQAAKWHDEQAAQTQKLSDMNVSTLDAKVWGDYAENHREYAAAIRAAAKEGKP